MSDLCSDYPSSVLLYGLLQFNAQPLVHSHLSSSRQCTKAGWYRLVCMYFGISYLKPGSVFF